MKYKKKNCIICSEERVIFSKGRCKFCAQIAYQKKAQENQKKKLEKRIIDNKELKEIESGYIESEMNENQIVIASYLNSKTNLSKKPTEKYKKQKEAEREAMKEFWNDKADELGICYCQECLLLNAGSGNAHVIASLGAEFNPFNVAHIISKGANKKFQSDKRNFILLCANHHTQFDAQFEGKTRRDMLIFAQTEAIRIKLKKEDQL